jgi:hypothetical protein
MNPIEKKRKKEIFTANKQKMCELDKFYFFKKLIDKIHKLIIKELKLNANHNIKIDKNHNLFQV